MIAQKILSGVAFLSITLLGGCDKSQVADPSTKMVSRNSSSNARLSQADAVDLGVAGNFAILSKSGITDVYKSSVSGDIGSSPITGAAILLECNEVTGTIYSVDAAGPACKITDATKLTTAVGDMGTAYTDAAGRSNPDFVNLGAGTIGGLTLNSGLYKWTSSLLIPTDITIEGDKDDGSKSDDVWIFQVAGTLDLSSAVIITLTKGAQAKNIYWQVAGAVSLGTTSHFEGNLLGATSISLYTGATVKGRLLAQTAVTLQMNDVVDPNFVKPDPFNPNK